VRDARPLIVNLAPTGMVPTREMTPHVPLNVDEVLDDVQRCRELGASIVHLHARDEVGAPTQDPEAFAPLIRGVREIDPELIVCVTCSGRQVNDIDRRAAVLDLEGGLRPEMASLTLGSNNFYDQASVNSPETIKELATRMLERGVKPELEAFEPGMVGYGRYLCRKGLIEEPCYLNVLLGGVATSPLTAAALAAFTSLIPESWTWALAGIGADQLDANLLAIGLGGHVRVGLEDNIWMDRERRELATNPGLVERVRDLAELAGRPVASPAQAREMLGLAAVQQPAKHV